MRDMVRWLADRHTADLAAINALAATVPGFTNDPAADVAGSAIDATTYGLPVGVQDATRTGALGRGKIPESIGTAGPEVIVFAGADGIQYPRPSQKIDLTAWLLEGSLTLVVQYVWRNPSTAAAQMACSRWLRAERAYLTALFRQAASFRTVNGVELRFGTLTFVDAYHDAESDAVVGGYAIAAETREAVPVFTSFAALSAPAP